VRPGARSVRRILLVAALLLAALPSLAAALTVNDVAREVRCPTCNTPLDVSSAPVALDMKQYIAERIDAGWDKQRIIDGLVDEFGEEVLATPPKSGFDLIAWIVPALAVALGLAAIPFIARAWARRPRAAPDDVPAPSPEEARRLEEELRRLR
jgi:cytochrome c-type biogenesis protein CcmH